MAEREGFEPSVPPFSSTRDFQSRSFGQLGHLSIFPKSGMNLADNCHLEAVLRIPSIPFQGQESD
jgi:hypothetical protein